MKRLFSFKFFRRSILAVARRSNASQVPSSSKQLSFPYIPTFLLSFFSSPSRVPATRVLSHYPPRRESPSPAKQVTTVAPALTLPIQMSSTAHSRRLSPLSHSTYTSNETSTMNCTLKFLEEKTEKIVTLGLPNMWLC